TIASPSPSQSKDAATGRRCRSRLSRRTRRCRRKKPPRRRDRAAPCGRRQRGGYNALTSTGAALSQPLQRPPGEDRLMVTVPRLRSDLQRSRAHLLETIRGLSEEQFRYAPAAATWSIAAHLAHLLRTERVFAERAERALTEPDPFIPSTRVANDD